MPLQLAPPAALIADTASALEEARRLTLRDYRIEIPTLRVILSSTALGPLEDTYIVPGWANFLITSIRGHLSPNVIATEEIAAAATNQVNLHRVAGTIGRLAVKAMTVRVRLKNDDRGDLKCFGKNDDRVRLSSLIPAAGGRPIRFKRFPLIVPGGDTLRMTAETTAGPTMGQNTECGLVLVGMLVSRKG